MMLDFLKFCGYAAVMLAIIPLAGFCVTGSWRQAWRYCRDWGRVMGWTILAGAVIFLIAVQLIPAP